tara:strand:+ start:1757 stop:3484 length:1728 start_codon:yes stop_codon:yes gene_type:complete
MADSTDVFQDINALLTRKATEEIFETLFKTSAEREREKMPEANSYFQLAQTLTDENSFANFENIFKDYSKKNDSYGPRVEAIESMTKSAFEGRRQQFEIFKNAHLEVEKMTRDDYLVSSTDKKGGIQNITTEDILGWSHEELTRELGKANEYFDAFSLSKNGYRHAPLNSSQNTISLARDITKYRDQILAGLEVAVNTGKIPNDERILRAIISGKPDNVKSIIKEEKAISSGMYDRANSNISSYSNLLNKLTAYETEPEQFRTFTDDILSGKKPTIDGKEISKDEHTQSIKAMQSMLSMFNSGQGSSLDYSTYINNINDSLTREIALRDKANQRYKEYAGALYSEADNTFDEIMAQYRESGFSENVINNVVTTDDGKKITTDKEKDKKTVILKDKTKEEVVIEQTDFDEKRHSINDPRPELKKANGKFVFMQDGKMKEWNNTAFVKEFDRNVPILDAGYDKFYWNKGKWNHISKIRVDTPITSPKAKEETELVRREAFNEMVKDIKSMSKKLGYTNIGDATKQTKGMPYNENVYRYAKSLWDKLPKKIKSDFRSFDNFMNAVIDAEKSDIEFNME